MTIHCEVIAETTRELLNFRCKICKYAQSYRCNRGCQFSKPIENCENQTMSPLPHLLQCVGALINPFCPRVTVDLQTFKFVYIFDPQSSSSPHIVSRCFLPHCYCCSTTSQLSRPLSCLPTIELASTRPLQWLALGGI